MRTDAKVGLICALALTIAVVAYFVMQHDTRSSNRATEPGQSLVSETPAHTSAATAPSGDFASAQSPMSPGPSSPPPAYTPSIAQTPLISPPSPATAPTGPLQITPPGSSPHGLLPSTAPSGPTATAPSPLTGGNPPAYGSGSYTPSSSSTNPPRSTIEVPSSERPRDSLLEHTPPRSTIGSGSGDSSIFGTNTSGNTYTVQSGDTLTSIARKNNTTVKALQAANPRVDSNHLKIKQVINLPAPGSSTSSTAGTSGTITDNGPATRPSRAAAHSGATPSATTRPAAAAGSSYTVKKGDTLRKIAKAVYGDEAQWKRIFRANRSELDSADDIEPGMTLKLPPK